MGSGLKEYIAMPESASTAAERRLRDVDGWEQQSEKESNKIAAEGYKLQQAEDAMPSKWVQKKEVLHIISPSYTEYPVPALWCAKQLCSFQTLSLGHQCPVQSSHTTLTSPPALHLPGSAIPQTNRAVFFPVLLWFSSNYLVTFSKWDAPTRY